MVRDYRTANLRSELRTVRTPPCAPVTTELEQAMKEQDGLGLSHLHVRRLSCPAELVVGQNSCDERGGCLSSLSLLQSSYSQTHP
jgi:hypothetical protein